MRRATLQDPVDVRGLGLHSGEPSHVRIRPAAWGTGWTVGAGEDRVTVGPSVGSAVPGASVVRLAEGAVSTPEHLFAAAYALGLTDLHIDVLQGGELPALDGSAAVWLDHLKAAGRVEGGKAEVKTLTQPVRVALGGGVATAHPASALEVSVEVDFGPSGPTGAYAGVVSAERFEEEVAWARTFVRAEDVPALRAAGRGRGATADNTVVWGGPSVLRSPDEPVRHKVLDLLGDLAWLGCPLRARVEVQRGHHALHHALVQAITRA